MDSTRRNLSAANDAEYGVEVLCAGWNPLVAASADSAVAGRRLIAELASGEIEAFLTRFYHFQQG